MKKLLLFLIYAVLIIFVAVNAFKLGPLVGTISILAICAFLIYTNIGYIFTAIARYNYMTDHGKGFLWYEKAYKTGKMRPTDALVYGYLLIRHGAIDTAEKIITKTLYIHKSKIPQKYVIGSKLNLALIKWKRGNLAEAICDIEEIYQDGFKTTVMYGTLGYFYLLNNQIDKAVEFNKEAMEFNSTDKVIRDNMAMSLFLSGDVLGAEKMYAELLSEDVKFIDPYYNYALVLQKKGDNNGAIENLEKALTFPEKYLSDITYEKINQKLEEIKSK